MKKKGKSTLTIRGKAKYITQPSKYVLWFVWHSGHQVIVFVLLLVLGTDEEIHGETELLETRENRLFLGLRRQHAQKNQHQG